MAAYGILLSDDLMFASRITGTARALNLELRTVRTTQAILDAAKAERPRCVILDLHQPQLDLPALTSALKRQGACTIIGYGAHVAADVLDQARRCGCDVVLPRSQFVNTLAESLPVWYGGTQSHDDSIQL